MSSAMAFRWKSASLRMGGRSSLAGRPLTLFKRHQGTLHRDPDSPQSHRRLTASQLCANERAKYSIDPHILPSSRIADGYNPRRGWNIVRK
jgi:hypothetical protein